MPFYGEKTDLSFLFEVDSTNEDEVSREGENRDVQDGLTEQQSSKMEVVIGTPQPRMGTMTGELDPRLYDSSRNDSSINDDLRYKGPVKVYTRRKFRSQFEDPPTISSSDPEQSYRRYQVSM